MEPRHRAHHSHRPIVLVVDDEPSVRETIGRRLKTRGYSVLLASDPEMARKLLENHFINLAIIDLRLRNPEDSNDRSGQELALEFTESLVPGLPTILLTAYRDMESLSAALQSAVTGLPIKVAIKQNGLTWLQDVEDLMVRSPINTGLRINHGALNQLIRRRKFQRKMTAREMEELLRRLFRIESVSSLHLQDLVPGRSGSGIILVRPRYEEEVEGATLVIKYGTRDNVKLEDSNYRRFVEPYILPRATVQIGTPAYTQRWGALRFLFVGSSDAVPEDFETYFANSRTTLKQLRSTMRDVFSVCCQGWYRGVRRWTPEDSGLRDQYVARLELDDPKRLGRINEAVREVLKGRPRQPVQFKSDPSRLQVLLGETERESLPDPVAYFYDAASSFPAPTLMAITHGDLHVRNIIVDSQGHPWLIDFFRTGWGHAFRDAAELESVVKFKLLDHRENLRNLLAFERALINAPALNQLPPISLPKSFDRPFGVVREIRKQIATVGGPKVMQEYRAALYFYALKELGRHRSADVDDVMFFSRRAHALYSAARIVAHLAGEF